MVEHLQGFPGEAVLWAFLLAGMIVWGRYKERNKKR